MPLIDPLTGETVEEPIDIAEKAIALADKLIARYKPLVEAARARFVTNMEQTGICKHGNVEWNCEDCDYDKDEAIRTALEALDRGR